MLSKYIYFIRHGETILNAQKIRQGEIGGLSEIGKKQVEELAHKIKNFKIKKIICSPLQRAIETCDIITSVLGKKEIIYSPLFKERKNPSSIIGKKYDDLEVKKIIDLIDKSYHEPNLRIEDEENFEDLKERALQAKKFLEQNSVKDTLVITHGIFLKMLLCVLIYDKDLKIEDYIRLSVFNPADNAGITIVKYNPYNFFSKNRWEILVYNDSPIYSKNLKI